jgi:hypothetical protein
MLQIGTHVKALLIKSGYSKVIRQQLNILRYTNHPKFLTKLNRAVNERHYRSLLYIADFFCLNFILPCLPSNHPTWATQLAIKLQNLPNVGIWPRGSKERKRHSVASIARRFLPL